MRPFVQIKSGVELAFMAGFSFLWPATTIAEFGVTRGITTQVKSATTQALKTALRRRRARSQSTDPG